MATVNNSATLSGLFGKFVEFTNNDNQYWGCEGIVFLEEDGLEFYFNKGVNIQRLKDELIVLFNSTCSGSFFAIWNKDKTRPLDEMPVAIFGDEGEIDIVARNFKEFMRLLSIPADEFQICHITGPGIVVFSESDDEDDEDDWKKYLPKKDDVEEEDDEDEESDKEIEFCPSHNNYIEFLKSQNIQPLADEDALRTLLLEARIELIDEFKTWLTTLDPKGDYSDIGVYSGLKG